MLNQLERLLDHMEWADVRTLESLRHSNGKPRQALEIYAHVLGAERVWLSRLEAKPPSTAVWPEPDLDTVAELAEQAHRGLRDLVSGLTAADLEREVSYTNSADTAFRTPIGDVLMHVFLHGMYHRGQVALLLRQDGSEPAPSDYIAFVRGAQAATRRDESA